MIHVESVLLDSDYNGFQFGDMIGLREIGLPNELREFLWRALWLGPYHSTEDGRMHYAYLCIEPDGGAMIASETITPHIFVRLARVSDAIDLC